MNLKIQCEGRCLCRKNTKARVEEKKNWFAPEIKKSRAGLGQMKASISMAEYLPLMADTQDQPCVQPASATVAFALIRPWPLLSAGNLPRNNPFLALVQYNNRKRYVPRTTFNDKEPLFGLGREDLGHQVGCFGIKKV